MMKYNTQILKLSTRLKVRELVLYVVLYVSIRPSPNESRLVSMELFSVNSVNNQTKAKCNELIFKLLESLD